MNSETVNSALELLEALIRTPSISRDESKTADIIEDLLKDNGFETGRIANNVWIQKMDDPKKPTLLLNSHHDTVKPVSGWSTDPFSPKWDGDKLIGLGANDAGASLVCLLYTFIEQVGKPQLPWNLVFLASSEEEISGANGLELALKELPAIDLAIVGEPTGMQMAIAEKGLVVVDAVAKGQSGHAARNEGINAIHIALEDIRRITEHQFEKVSDLLGPVKMTVTQIDAGIQHNIVPDECRYVIDIRTNEHYSNRSVVETLQNLLESSISARSFRLNSSGLPADHPAIMLAAQLGIPTYGSPTLSDQALMDFPSLKMGPGLSERSHTAGEFILRSEIEEGIEGYRAFLNNLKL